MITTQIVSTMTSMLLGVVPVGPEQASLPAVSPGQASEQFDRAMEWANTALHEGEGHQKLLLCLASLLLLLVLAGVRNMLYGAPNQPPATIQPPRRDQ